MYCNNNIIFTHVNSNMLSGMQGKSIDYTLRSWFSCMQMSIIMHVVKGCSKRLF